MIVHLGAKWATVRTHVGRRRVAEPAADAADRRTFLTAVAASAGVVVLAVAGNTVAGLSRISVLAQRRPGVGPQGVPVNKSARGAGVAERAVQPGYRLVVTGPRRARRTFTLDELRAMPQHEAELPIACVEGWSTSAHWRGVRVRDLVDSLGVDRFHRVQVTSMQRGGRYRRSELTTEQVADDDTLLALELNGEVLHVDHGYPARLIAPNRPGVLQTKWVASLEVR
jgi:hypothetical protein